MNYSLNYDNPVSVRQASELLPNRIWTTASKTQTNEQSAPLSNTVPCASFELIMSRELLSEFLKILMMTSFGHTNKLT